MLPKASDKVEIVHDFFGKRIKSGKEYLECTSEEEARYIKVFLESGLTEVEIPGDKQFLISILPELEEIQKRNDEIIKSYLDSIISNKIKKALQHKIWSEIMK